MIFFFFFPVSNEKFFSTKNVLIVVYMGIQHAYLDTDLYSHPNALQDNSTQLNLDPKSQLYGVSTSWNKCMNFLDWLHQLPTLISPINWLYDSVCLESFWFLGGEVGKNKRKCGHCSCIFVLMVDLSRNVWEWWDDILWNMISKNNSLAYDESELQFTFLRVHGTKST